MTSSVYDLKYCRMTGEFKWIFDTPDTEDELQILFYAGVPGETKDIGITYHNVKLSY